MLITGPAFEIKQFSPSLEIGCVSYKFISFVEYWRMKSILDKAQYKYFILTGRDGKGGAVHNFITRFTVYGSTPVWTKSSIGRSSLLKDILSIIQKYFIKIKEYWCETVKRYIGTKNISLFPEDVQSMLYSQWCWVMSVFMMLEEKMISYKMYYLKTKRDGFSTYF